MMNVIVFFSVLFPCAYLLFYSINMFKENKKLLSMNENLSNTVKESNKLNQELVIQCTAMNSQLGYYKMHFDNINNTLKKHAVNMGGVPGSPNVEEVKYNVDEILDEINQVGIENVDKNKINFLRKQK